MAAILATACSNPSPPARNAVITAAPVLACAHESLVEVRSVDKLPKRLKEALDHYGEPRNGLYDLNNEYKEGSCGLIVAGTNPECALVSLGCGGYVPRYLILEYWLDQNGWHETKSGEGGDRSSLQVLKEMASANFLR